MLVELQGLGEAGSAPVCRRPGRAGTVGTAGLGAVWHGWAWLGAAWQPGRVAAGGGGTRLIKQKENSMVYKFKGGSYKGLDAQKTGEELERIRQVDGGRLLTSRVWSEALREDSPIHKAFTWDVDKAAKERWADQARELVRVVLSVEGETERSAFINVSVRTNETEDAATIHYYQAVQIIASNPLEYESALAASKTRLAMAQNSLQELLGLAGREDKPRIRRAHKHVEAATQALTA